MKISIKEQGAFKLVGSSHCCRLSLKEKIYDIVDIGNEQIVLRKVNTSQKEQVILKPEASDTLLIE